MHLDELVTTARRRAREDYCRYIAFRAGIDAEDIESLMADEVPALEGSSVLGMIYRGDADRAVRWVEKLVDIFIEELAAYDDEEEAA